MNKKFIVPIAIVAVAVLAGAVWYIAQKPTTSSNTEDKTNPEATTNETTPPQVAPEPGPMPPPTPGKTAPAPNTQTTLSYDEALKKYGTNRIQFDANCKATPSSATYKSGTQVMFDNRANVSRKIVFNGKTYTLAAYGYTIVPMTNATYPAVAYIDCEGSQNVGKVVIQQ